MFFPRGDPATFDFVNGDMTLDNTYYDWDLTSIIPIGTQAVLLAANLANTGAYSHFFMREKGHVNDVASTMLVSGAATLVNREVAIIVPNSNRIVEYRGKTGGWTIIQLTVIGWWK